MHGKLINIWRGNESVVSDLLAAPELTILASTRGPRHQCPVARPNETSHFRQLRCVDSRQKSRFSPGSFRDATSFSTPRNFQWDCAARICWNSRSSPTVPHSDLGKLISNKWNGALEIWSTSRDNFTVDRPKVSFASTHWNGWTSRRELSFSRLPTLKTHNSQSSTVFRFMFWESHGRVSLWSLAKFHWNPSAESLQVPNPWSWGLGIWKNGVWASFQTIRKFNEHETAGRIWNRALTPSREF